MEKCWDRVLSTRPRPTDILVLLETASRGWVSPASEAIASLSPPNPNNQNYFTMEPADTISEAIGSGAVGSREVGQSPPISNGEERAAATRSATVEDTFSLTSLTHFLVSIIPNFYKLIRHLQQRIRRVRLMGK